eukprot:6171792-Amphidinium_carterae.1
MGVKQDARSEWIETQSVGAVEYLLLGRELNKVVSGRSEAEWKCKSSFLYAGNIDLAVSQLLAKERQSA